MRYLSQLMCGAVLAVAVLVPPAARAQKAPPVTPASAEVVSDLQVRTLNLEQTLAQLTGQIEELRFQNQQLSKQVQKLQDDLSLRVMRLEQGGAAANGAPAEPGSAAPSALGPGASAVPVEAPAPVRSAAPTQLLGQLVPSETYDKAAPMSAPVQRQPDMSPQPSAPAPKAAETAAAAPKAQASADGGFVVRTDASGKPLPPDPNAPRAPAVTAPLPPAPAPRAAPTPGPVTAGGLSTGQISVSLPDGTPKQQYDFAYDLLTRQDYGRAESAFREFLKRNGKDPLAGNAQYWLGETLYVRGDYQNAAVEFMNGFQNYHKSSKGPDNLLKLGMSMAHMNQTQGACTAFANIAKEYPDASDQIRKTAQTERAKLKCT